MSVYCRSTVHWWWQPLLWMGCFRIKHVVFMGFVDNDMSNIIILCLLYHDKWALLFFTNDSSVTSKAVPGLSLFYFRPYPSWMLCRQKLAHQRLWCSIRGRPTGVCSESNYDPGLPWDHINRIILMSLESVSAVIDCSFHSKGHSFCSSF